MAIGFTLFAAGTIVLAIWRLTSQGRTAIVDLLWAVAFSMFVARRFTIDLIGVGDGLQNSWLLSGLMVVFAGTAIILEYHLTGTIFGGFGE